ncbi:hypothetical protein PCANC_23944 [Puccinia coronata f. sp. avenae]|uniref:Uncharacterized protein n=1 Tax=Puccinia coronata f. sp. avenae TaxID=200324 RepID=A0A2N5S774_9BASI|nr:hypothetical protein PCANC_23944 [Puccinia coronata f. sp. avenae]
MAVVNTSNSVLDLLSYFLLVKKPDSTTQLKQFSDPPLFSCKAAPAGFRVNLTPPTPTNTNSSQPPPHDTPVARFRMTLRAVHNTTYTGRPTPHNSPTARLTPHNTPAQRPPA